MAQQGPLARYAGRRPDGFATSYERCGQCVSLRGGSDLLLGLRTHAEAILEPAWHRLEVAHTARALSAATLGLDTPVDCEKAAERDTFRSVKEF